jgi:hypothetical protein
MPPPLQLFTGTDYWRAYDTLSSEGYVHGKVNHSLNFVSPTDPSVNTQRIERMWKTMKRIMPKECSTELKWTYLDEHVWKQRNHWFGLTIGERIELIIRALSTIKFD